MYEIATIPFKETPGFISIRDEQTGEVYVAPKSVCEIFGIAWQTQQRKIAEAAARWDYKTITVKLPGDDQERSIAVIPDRKVRSWICGISAEKVKAEIRAQLRAFQDECDEVLHQYWTKGIAVNPRSGLIPLQDLKIFLGEVVGTAVKSAIAEVSSGLVVSIREENKHMMAATVKATVAEIRSEDPVYLAAKKWDVIERMHEKEALPKEQMVAAQQAILNMLFPGSKGKSLADLGLTHAADFLHDKSLRGYRWNYKTLEAAAAQLTKEAKKIWEQENYQAAKESVTLQSGRTVTVYVFPPTYAEKAFTQLVEAGKIYQN